MHTTSGNRWKGPPMKLLTALMLTPISGQAATVFDGYEAYYATLPNRLFEGEGTVSGPQKMIEVREGMLRINGRTLNRNRIKAFANEIASDSDLGLGTTAYFAAEWTCAENTPTAGVETSESICILCSNPLSEQPCHV